MANKPMRASYTAEFKLKVVSKAEEVGNRESGRLFQIDEKCVRQWRSKKAELMLSDRNRRANRGKAPSWPELEKNLAKWTKDQRSSGRSVSTSEIRLTARRLAQDMGISDFKGGPTWCQRFMRRENLGGRSKTMPDGHKFPGGWKEKMGSFLLFTTDMMKDFEKRQVITMDEVPMTFEAESVTISTAEDERTCFTVVLGCAADGSKLKPMTIFKRKTLPEEDFPNGVVVKCNQQGWMNEDLMVEWFDEVWKTRPGADKDPRGVLILDSMKAHLHDTVKDKAQHPRVGATLSVIPNGLTRVLLPLAISVNKNFKALVRSRWADRVASELHSYAKSGKVRRISFPEILRCIKESWDEVPAYTIVAGFQKAELIAKGCPSSSIEADYLSSAPEDSMAECDSDTQSSEFDGFEETFRYDS